MTKLLKLNIVGTVAMVFVLTTACAAFAGKSGGGKSKASDTPKESVTFTYGKMENTYSQQKKSGTGAGKAKVNEITIKKTTDKASP